MAQGEAEHGCAQDEPCRPGHHEPAVTTHQRRLAGGPPAHPGEAPTGHLSERTDDDVMLPRQRSAEPFPPATAPADGCLSDRPGWAGAHRHGPVRPRPRAGRRQRPPGRWC